MSACIATVAVLLLGLQASCGVAPAPPRARAPQGRHPNQPVRAGAAVPGRHGTVAATDPSAPVAAAPTTMAGAMPVATPATGVRSVLIMMVNWTKPDLVTPASAQQQINVETNNWYAEASYFQLGFRATATPWMSVASSDCSLTAGGYWNILAAAEAQARSRGYDPAAYDHEMVYFPTDTRCGYGGISTTGGRISWVNGELNARVTVHELGHNLGLHHSSSGLCRDAAGRQTTVSASCSHDEYGDLFDGMGAVVAGTPHQFNALQKFRLGWLAGHYATVTAATSVVLSPLESGSGVMGARIQAGGTEYWLEYRRAVGTDASLAYSPGALDGVLVHRPTAEGATELLDGRPDASNSFTNAAVPVGSRMTTPEGVTCKVTSANNLQAVVEIAFAAAPK